MNLPRLALTVSLLGALGSSTAQAASVAPKGKARVHLDTEVLAWTQSRAAFSFPATTRTNTFGVGFGRPVAGAVPFGGSVIALGVGYGVHKHLIFGARFGVNYTSLPRTSSGLRSEAFSVTFTPYLEILPIPEGRVLPFILVRTGITGGLQAVEIGPEFQVHRAFAPSVGTGVGAHAFVARFFSIDFGVTFDHRWLYTLNANGTTGGPPVTARWGHGSNTFTLAATLGLSTWF